MLAVMKKLTYDEEYNFENEVLCYTNMNIQTNAT